MTTKAEMRDQPQRHSTAKAALTPSGAVNIGRSGAAWFRPQVVPSASTAYLAHGAFSPLTSTSHERVPSAFLPPFTPQALPRFYATMRVLTPAPVSPRRRSPCFTYTIVANVPPPTTPRVPAAALSRCLQRGRFPAEGERTPGGTPPARLSTPVKASPFPSRLADRARPNRVRHPADRSHAKPLLPTTPRDDAVTASFWSERQPGGDFHPSDDVRSQAH
jgi:hypothetical protein